MQHLGQFIQNHWTLWLALVVILFTLFIYETMQQKKKAKELSAAAAVDLINHHDAVVVDIRDIMAFKAGHIINAVQASEDDFSKQKLSKFKDKPVILVCAKGLQSANVAAKLREQGYTQPLVLSGGITSWQSAGLPLVKGKG